tara:strand:+ start:43 stop:198 length:156 start_codon:yes stop_codon:yes gene_type:complete
MKELDYYLYQFSDGIVAPYELKDKTIIGIWKVYQKLKDKTIIGIWRVYQKL